MTEKVEAETKFSNKFLHVGVIVKDMDKAIERLESLGIGPFKPYPFESLPDFLRHLHPILAALAMSVSSVTVVSNSLRLYRSK